MILSNPKDIRPCRGAQVDQQVRLDSLQFVRGEIPAQQVLDQLGLTVKKGDKAQVGFAAMPESTRDSDLSVSLNRAVVTALSEDRCLSLLLPKT